MFCFFNGPPPPEIYTYLHTLSLRDALPVPLSRESLDVEHGKAPATGRPQHQPAGELAEQRQRRAVAGAIDHRRAQRLPAKSARILSQQLLGLPLAAGVGRQVRLDRKSTSLNSSH